jgi:circadian clock protein KaiC
VPSSASRIVDTLQENPAQLEPMVGGFGWSLAQPNVELMYRSPVDVYLEEWFYDLLEAIERTDASRVLVDSLADLRLATTDEVRSREYLTPCSSAASTGRVRRTDGAKRHIADRRG